MSIPLSAGQTRRGFAIGAVSLVVAPAPLWATSGVEKLIWHATPRPVTDEPFQDGAGESLSLSRFRGQVVIVNLWATWCAPCVREMPTLDTLQADLGAQGVKVVAMSQDREGAELAGPFKKSNGWSNLDLYVEPLTKFARAAEVKGLPTTLIVDKAGFEVARLQGTAEWDSPEMKKVIGDLLAKTP